MIVLKDKTKRANTSLRPVKVLVSTKGMFRDPKERSYRNREDEKAYRIAPDASYRPLDCVKRMGW